MYSKKEDGPWEEFETWDDIDYNFDQIRFKKHPIKGCLFGLLEFCLYVILILLVLAALGCFITCGLSIVVSITLTIVVMILVQIPALIWDRYKRKTYLKADLVINKINKDKNVVTAKKDIKKYLELKKKFHSDFGYLFDEILIPDGIVKDDDGYFKEYKTKHWISYNSIHNTAAEFERIHRMYNEKVKDGIYNINRTIEKETSNLDEKTKDLVVETMNDLYSLNIESPKLQIKIKLNPSNKKEKKYKYIEMDEDFLRRQLPSYD